MLVTLFVLGIWTCLTTERIIDNFVTTPHPHSDTRKVPAVQMSVNRVNPKVPTFVEESAVQMNIEPIKQKVKVKHKPHKPNLSNLLEEEREIIKEESEALETEPLLSSNKSSNKFNFTENKWSFADVLKAKKNLSKNIWNSKIKIKNFKLES